MPFHNRPARGRQFADEREDDGLHRILTVIDALRARLEKAMTTLGEISAKLDQVTLNESAEHQAIETLVALVTGLQASAGTLSPENQALVDAAAVSLDNLAASQAASTAEAGAAGQPPVV